MVNNSKDSAFGIVYERKFKFMTIAECKNIIRGRLTPVRFFHSCMVSNEAMSLAQRYAADKKAAGIAGMLHDITKDTPADIQLQILEKNCIILDEVEKTTAKLLHAISAQALLSTEYGIDDQDILNAIRYHTTARAGMSTLEKIIYLADFVSHDRHFEGINELRHEAYTSLESGMKSALGYTINELIAKSNKIHVDTVKAWNELLMK